MNTPALAPNKFLADFNAAFSPVTHAPFVDVKADLNRRFFERTIEVTILLVGLISRQHVLLIGPPGTGKSLLVRELAKYFALPTFDLLVGRTTVPEQVFGPLSLGALADDRYERKMSGYLPEADVAFLDEIFKANSAILNSILTVLNERQYRNGDHVVTCPLRSCVGASNEWANEDALDALDDRFLLRTVVRPLVHEKSFRGLLTTGVAASQAASIDRTTLDAAGLAAAALPVSDRAIDTCLRLRTTLSAVAQPVLVSDRRWRSAISVCQANAWLDGAVEVGPRHLSILRHVLWRNPEDEKVVSEAIANVLPTSDVALAELDKLMVEARAALAQSTDVRTTTLAVLSKLNTRLGEAKLILKGPDLAEYTTKFDLYFAELRQGMS